MNKFTRYQKIIVSLIAFLLVFVLMSTSFQSVKSVNGVLYNAFASAKYALIDGPIAFIGNVVDDFQTLWSVKEENEALRRQLSQIQFDAFQYKETSLQLEELKELMDINNLYDDFDQVSANVILRDQEMWNNTLLVDVGANKNIQKDMAVISSKGLIGKVEEVYDNTAKIKLLTTLDNSNKVSVKITYDDTSVDAVLERYDIDRKSFVLRLFSNNDDIAVGDAVVTSGMGGVFPPGINVGKINEIVNLNNKLGKTIYVTPDADFENFQYVTIITKVE
ncbi:MAG: rod shape-determining protein MreC [Erysipelotrichaceae bacterium]